MYLDFCKDFDEVDHRIVLMKLRAIGISGRLFKQIGNFLIGREHGVVVDRYQSDVNSVNSGVPQRSVLGPLLFFILISDVDCELVEASASSLADDMRILMAIGNDEDRLKIQQELNKVYQWASDNAMLFTTPSLSILCTGHIKVQRAYRATQQIQVIKLRSQMKLEIWVF